MDPGKKLTVDGVDRKGTTLCFDDQKPFLFFKLPQPILYLPSAVLETLASSLSCGEALINIRVRDIALINHALELFGSKTFF